jgi:hypothetical protein
MIKKLNTSYVSMKSRRKFEGCMDNINECVKNISCKNCQYDHSDELFDALIIERRIKLYGNEYGI